MGAEEFVECAFDVLERIDDIEVGCGFVRRLEGTSLRLATRPWLISTGQYSGIGPPVLARPGPRPLSLRRATTPAMTTTSRPE